MKTRSRSGRYARFLGLAVAIVLGLCVVGWLPTRRLAGAGGVPAMVVRLAVVVVLGMAAALSGELARQPLLFWIGTAYVALLPLEVKLAIL